MQTTQLQVRMDLKTKRDAQKVLASLGMDASTAVKVLFKQIAITKSFPLDIRDENGFTTQKAAELQEAIDELEKGGGKVYKNSREMMDDILQ